MGQIVQVPVTQEPTRNGEVAREDRLTELHVEAHIVEAQGFLTGWIAAGAHTVTDVVMNEPRFDGVQIRPIAWPLASSIITLLIFGSPWIGR